MSPPLVRLQEKIHSALKSGDRRRVEVLRLLLAAARKVEIDSQKNMDKSGLFAVMEKMIKQRRESIEWYLQGGREDLAEREKEEIDILLPLLPPRMDAAKVEAIIAAAIADTGAAGMRDMGRVMAAIKSKLAGKADMGLAGRRVKEILSGL